MRIPVLFAAVCAVVSVFAGQAFAKQTGGVRIVKVERSAPFPSAKVRVVSPEDRGYVFSLSPEIKLEVSDYTLGVSTETQRKSLIADSGGGQHIHLIVDNEPYMAIYDVSKPVRLKNLSVGPHTLVVFPSRSYHESVKTPDSAHVVNFQVFTSFAQKYPLAPSTPALIYSRPKGVYEGKDADRIMVDFYLRNVSIGENGYRVKLSVFQNDIRMDNLLITDMFDRWQPAFVEGLQTGYYTFLLELIDPRGKTVPGIFGAQSRIVRVVR